MNKDEFCASEDPCVMNCDPCMFENTQQEATAFCYDCKEFLCQPCLQFHRKFQAFRHHDILHGDSMPRTREDSKTKLELKLCDNHRLNEVQFYCENHKTVFCCLCQVARHQKCDCKLIAEMSSKHEDKTKFDNIMKAMKAIRTEFEHLRAEKIEIIDATSVSSRIEKDQLESLRNEMNAFFIELENDLKEKESQERMYITELRANVSMYSDVINNLTVLTEKTDCVSNSDDKVAIFAATCKLTKIHEDYKTLKDSITLKSNAKQTPPVEHKLMKLKGMWDTLKKETKSNKLTLKKETKSNKLTLKKETKSNKLQKNIDKQTCLKAMGKQVSLQDIDKGGQKQATDKQTANRDTDKHTTIRDTDKHAVNRDTDKHAVNRDTDKHAANRDTDKHAANRDTDKHAANRDTDKHSANRYTDKHPANWDTDKHAGTAKAKVTETINEKEPQNNNTTANNDKIQEEYLRTKNGSKHRQQQKSNENSVEELLEKEIKKDGKASYECLKEGQSDAGDLNAKEISKVSNDKPELLFENLNFGTFLYKYVNTCDSRFLCDITGSLFLPDGSLILCDHGNSSVLLFDKAINLLDKHNFRCKVWDVALANKDEVIVSVTNQKMLVFLKVKAEKLHLGNKLNLKRQPWGIAVYKDYLLITFHNNPGDGIIQIRFKSGKILRDISVDEKGEKLFEAPYYIDVNQNSGDIYVTDSRKNRITCLSFEGNVLYRVESAEFMWPRKIILDDQANCLLCAGFNNKILLIKNKQESSLLSEETGGVEVALKACTRPQTVSVRRDDHTTIVGLNSSNMILVLKSQINS